MKNSLILFFLAPILILTPNILAHDLNPLAVAQAVGRFVEVDGVAGWMVEIPKKTIRDIDIGRKLAGRPRTSGVNEKPWVNLEYLFDAFALLEADLRDQIGQQPTDHQMFAAWLHGTASLRRSGWDPVSTLGKDGGTRWILYQTQKDQIRKASIPTPLPTDGRRPVPTRLTQGTRNEQ